LLQEESKNAMNNIPVNTLSNRIKNGKIKGF
jgi:hypothetical protein